jgi:hypothetical protein
LNFCTAPVEPELDLPRQAMVREERADRRETLGIREDRPKDGVEEPRLGPVPRHDRLQNAVRAREHPVVGRRESARERAKKKKLRVSGELIVYKSEIEQKKKKKKKKKTHRASIWSTCGTLS